MAKLLTREEYQQVTTLRPWHFSAVVLGNWLVILLAGFLFYHFQGPVSFLFASLVVATRQHALLILKHDASHGLWVRSERWNDRLSDFFLAWPHFITTASYRRDHLNHHRFVRTDKDPLYASVKDDPEWQFPMKRTRFLRSIVADVLGRGLWQNLKKMISLNKDDVKPSVDLLVRGAYYGCLGLLALQLQYIGNVVVCWFFSLGFLLPALLRLRNVAEHFGLPVSQDIWDATRVYTCSFWERLLFAPHNIWLHLDHHLVPNVPFYNLPQLHKILQEKPTYLHKAKVKRGIFLGPQSLFKSLLF